MDKTRALRMTTDLLRKSIGGWRIKGALGSGKSALVLDATRRGVNAALKIFDPEIVERFGADVQRERLNRELALRDKSHPNLVRILDGGVSHTHGNFFYVVMEKVSGRPLAERLQDLPRTAVQNVLTQIAAASRYLETLGLAHRDIKPENVMVSEDFRQVCLMDLGVLRPFGVEAITDADERPFIGTLQYSSPEYLLRKERDSPDGWRALTFYQLGAVLHDMIMRRPLFRDYCSPFAELVKAVLEMSPDIHATDISPDLVVLARSCLVKDPDLRLRLVSWEQFSVKPTPDDPIRALQDRIRTRQEAARHNSPLLITDAAWRAIRRTLEFVEDAVQAIVRRECIASSIFPPLELFDFGEDLPSTTSFYASFAPSSDYALSKRLVLHFTIELLDQISVAVHIRFAASLLKEPGGSVDSPPVFTSLFEGCFSEPLVSEAIRVLMYTALDAAMEVADISSVVEWLNLDISENQSGIA